MGYLVEGIGDEVLLFGAFLTFATCVVIFVNSWRERENRQRQGQSNQTPGQESSQDDAGVQDGTGVQNTAGDTLSTKPPSQIQSSSSTSEGSELRSRLRQSATQSTSTGGACNSKDETSQPEPVQDERPREEDGDSLITVRLIMHGSTTKPVRVSTVTTLAEMRRTHFRQEISENRPVKFIYQGRVLNNDSSTLQELNITDGCPVHIHVGRPRDNPQQRAENERQQVNEFLDISRFFVPLFGVILGIAWVVLFCYPTIFTFITKLFLFCLSIGYFLLAYLTTIA